MLTNSDTTARTSNVVAVADPRTGPSTYRMTSGGWPAAAGSWISSTVNSTMTVPIANVAKFAMSIARGTVREACPVSSPAGPLPSNPEITKTGTSRANRNGRTADWPWARMPPVEVSVPTPLKWCPVAMTAMITPMITIAIAKNSATTPTVLLNAAAIFTAVRLITVDATIRITAQPNVRQWPVRLTPNQLRMNGEMPYASVGTDAVWAGISHQPTCQPRPRLPPTIRLMIWYEPPASG